VKPVVPKLFAARVYAEVLHLRREYQDLAGETAVLTSDPVSFLAEARTFILDVEQGASGHASPPRQAHEQSRPLLDHSFARRNRGQYPQFPVSRP
jgi:hypothetical protein